MLQPAVVTLSAQRATHWKKRTFTGIGTHRPPGAFSRREAVRHVNQLSVAVP
jgi:hypothetical protein